MGELFAVLPSKGSLRKVRPIIGTPRAAPQSGSNSEKQQGELPPRAARQQEAHPEPRAPSLAKMDWFGLTGQWQQAWLRGIESYTRLFMPWLRR
jgi:hypothetical protein